MSRLEKLKKEIEEIEEMLQLEKSTKSFLFMNSIQKSIVNF